MFRFNTLLRKDDATESGGNDLSPEAQELEKALIEEGLGNGSTPDKGAEDKGTPGSDKSKPAGSDKGGAAEDDPEEEIDVKEMKDGKEVATKVKVKRSELKAGYLRQQDYTAKTQRLAEIEKNQKDLITTAEAIRQHKGLSKIFVTLVQKAISEKGYNEEFITKQLEILDEVAPAPGDNKKDLKENQDDIEKLLEGVDPDSPIAKALKQTWKANQDMLAKMKGLEEGQGKFAKTLGEKEAKEQEAQYNALVDTASKTLNSTLDEMADETKSGLSFFTPGEKQEWRWKVVAFLRDNPMDYKDDADFVKRVSDVGKAVHGAMTKYREEILAQQLSTKKPKEEPKKETTSAEAATLEEDILKELEAIENNGSNSA